MTRELTPTALLDVLDELALAVEHAKRAPLSADVKVNRDDLLNLINELRAGLPGAIEAADELHAQAGRELQEAKRAGEEALSAARARAIELVEQEAVVAQAHGRAEGIVGDAYAEAAKLRREADEYCDSRLAEFEAHLASLGQQVQLGRARLAERLG
ncbi:MAG: hypothetical protein FWG11_04520 [Promicromonosporaceae bacterium]|nr:hypothetical protein [Promicromonosporaceae bacterium]